jgi:hypothetical protein
MKVNRVLAAMLKSEPAEIEKCIYNPSRESHSSNDQYRHSLINHISDLLRSLSKLKGGY